MLDLKSWELARYNVDDTPTQAALDAMAARVSATIDEAANAILSAKAEEAGSGAASDARALAERRAFMARMSVAATLEEIAAAKSRAVVPITFEVKRLNRKQAQIHQRTFAAALKAEVEKLRAADVDPGGQAEGETEGAAMVRSLHARANMEVAGIDFYETIGEDYIRQCFEQFTRNWTGVKLDGMPVTEGALIADIADNALVRFVLTEINRASRLTVMEGNASASPSGSAQAAGIATADSISTAPSIESAAGTAA